ncbi:MAG: RNA polymerase sigma factor [Bacteroidales bacterium]|nr:RNA polymerase sigma factor [Bacteroidales bacterium]
MSETTANTTNQEKMFREAILENDRRIYSICCHYFGPGDEAKDAYQEILLKIWLNILNFRGDSQLKTWVSRIAVNVCMTYLSKRNKKSSVFVPLSNIDCDTRTEDSDDKSEDEEAKFRFFEDYKKKLSSLDKILVTLYLDDIDYAEISMITGLSEGNARAKIHRIKKQIKKEWEEKYGTR